MNTVQFVQAEDQERNHRNLRPAYELNLSWDVKYLPEGKVHVALDDAGNSYTVTEVAGDEDFPLLLTITPPARVQRVLRSNHLEPLRIRCSWYAEAASYAEDFNWNRQIGYVAHGHVMGIITTCWR